MAYDVDQPIAAIASAPGGAARGVVRMSGRDVLARLSRCFAATTGETLLGADRRPRRIAGTLLVEADEAGGELAVPGELLCWSTERSYTRQPAAEFHTSGSSPLLSAIVEQLARVGIRSAEPGEFTLRAFLAGRIDLTQAEAVLGVIDARQRAELDSALDQLAGGLSRPLHELRERLLDALAELEAGLDFVDEDIEFISREALGRQLAEAQQVVDATLRQVSQRDRRSDAPRVALVGPPNAGKSSLFNALLSRYGATGVAGAIVSPMAGTTRDYVAAEMTIDGLILELIDTAGEDAATGDAILQAAQRATELRRRDADLIVRCDDASRGQVAPPPPEFEECLWVHTKADLTPPDGDGRRRRGGPPCVRCSSVSGEGLRELALEIRRRLAESRAADSSGGLAAATAARCTGSLRAAARSLQAAVALVDEQAAGEELIAAELRSALDALGEVVGAVFADDVLDRVFSRFCIGK